jgi:hypothetical protein
MKTKHIDNIRVVGQSKYDSSGVEGCGIVKKYEYRDKDDFTSDRMMRDAWYIVVYNGDSRGFRMIEVWPKTISVSIKKLNEEEE